MKTPTIKQFAVNEVEMILEQSVFDLLAATNKQFHDGLSSILTEAFKQKKSWPPVMASKFEKDGFKNPKLVKSFKKEVQGLTKLKIKRIMDKAIDEIQG